MMLMSAAPVVAWLGSSGRQAPAVDEGQRPLRAKVAKVDFGGPGRRIGKARTLSCRRRRQLVEDIVDARCAAEFDVLIADRHDRGGRRKVRLRNARPGNDDFVSAADGSAIRAQCRRGVGFDGPGRGCGAGLVGWFWSGTVG